MITTQETVCLRCNINPANSFMFVHIIRLLQKKSNVFSSHRTTYCFDHYYLPSAVLIFYYFFLRKAVLSKIFLIGTELQKTTNNMMISTWIIFNVNIDGLFWEVSIKIEIYSECFIFIYLTYSFIFRNNVDANISECENCKRFGLVEEICFSSSFSLLL